MVPRYSVTALDASLKVHHPSYRDRCYFILPHARNLVFGTKDLNSRCGRYFEYSKAFPHNPHGVGGRIFGIVRRGFRADALKSRQPGVAVKTLRFPSFYVEKKW